MKKPSNQGQGRKNRDWWREEGRGLGHEGLG